MPIPKALVHVNLEVCRSPRLLTFLLSRNGNPAWKEAAVMPACCNRWLQRSLLCLDCT